MSLLIGVVALTPVVAGTASGQHVRDSAGVRIVRYRESDRPTQVWRVDAKPLLQIGGPEGTGPTEFSDVAGVARLANGSTVVADAGTNQLRRFDSTGKFVLRMGRMGMGPGEFDVLRRLVRVADTVGGVDQSGRLQVFAPDGSLKRSVARPAFRVGSLSFQTGYFGDWWLLAIGYPEPPDMTLTRQTALMQVGIVSVDGSDQRIVATVPGVEPVRSGGGPPMPIQFGPQSKIVVAGDRFCGGYPSSFAISCYDRRGRLLTRTERSVARAKLPAEAREYYRRRMLGGMSRMSAAAQQQMREYVRLTQFAEYTPAYGNLVGAATGDLWVPPYDYHSAMQSTVVHPTGSRPQRWNVIAPDGLWLADVDLPARFALLDVGRDYVAGILRDNDDVEQVVVFRLRR
ncbi:MAG: hypothetical protein Q8K82_01465 [Gemmatimonadaceae bacterium]|nr:hypothetical protein [Gemmatimonadaceae bacterium]